MPLLSVLETAHYDLLLGHGTFASYYTMQVYNPALSNVVTTHHPEGANPPALHLIGTS
jgi:hypothetical protein